MIRIGIIGCGRILAAHLKGYRLLREAGVDDFRITALCARNIDDARSYVRRGEGPAQRSAVSNIPGDALAVGDEFLSDFQDDVDVEIYDDFHELIASESVDAINDFTLHGLHHVIARLAAENGKHLLTQKPMSVTVAGARMMCEAFDTHDLTLGVFENWRFRPDSIRMSSLFQAGILGKPQLIHAGAIGAWWAPNNIVAETPWRHRIEQAGGTTPTICGPGPVVYTSKGQLRGNRFTDDAGVEHSLAGLYEQHIPVEQRNVEIPFGLEDSFALTQLDWLDAIRDTRAPIVDGQEGLRDLACAWAVLESSRAGRRVTLDEILSGEVATVQREIAPHFGLET